MMLPNRDKENIRQAKADFISTILVDEDNCGEVKPVFTKTYLHLENGKLQPSSISKSYEFIQQNNLSRSYENLTSGCTNSVYCKNMNRNTGNDGRNLSKISSSKSFTGDVLEGSLARRSDILCSTKDSQSPCATVKSIKNMFENLTISEISHLQRSKLSQFKGRISSEPNLNLQYDKEDLSIKKINSHFSNAANFSIGQKSLPSPRETFCLRKIVDNSPKNTSVVFIDKVENLENFTKSNTKDSNDSNPTDRVPKKLLTRCSVVPGIPASGIHDITDKKEKQTCQPPTYTVTKFVGQAHEKLTYNEKKNHEPDETVSNAEPYSAFAGSPLVHSTVRDKVTLFTKLFEKETTNNLDKIVISPRTKKYIKYGDDADIFKCDTNANELSLESSCPSATDAINLNQPIAKPSRLTSDNCKLQLERASYSTSTGTDYKKEQLTRKTPGSVINHSQLGTFETRNSNSFEGDKSIKNQNEPIICKKTAEKVLFTDQIRKRCNMSLYNAGHDKKLLLDAEYQLAEDKKPYYKTDMTSLTPAADNSLEPNQDVPFFTIISSLNNINKIENRENINPVSCKTELRDESCRMKTDNSYFETNAQILLSNSETDHEDNDWEDSLEIKQQEENGFDSKSPSRVVDLMAKFENRNNHGRSQQREGVSPKLISCGVNVRETDEEKTYTKDRITFDDNYNNVSMTSVESPSHASNRPCETKKQSPDQNSVSTIISDDNNKTNPSTDVGTGKYDPLQAFDPEKEYSEEFVRESLCKWNSIRDFMNDIANDEFRRSLEEYEGNSSGSDADGTDSSSDDDEILRPNSAGSDADTDEEEILSEEKEPPKYTKPSKQLRISLRNIPEDTLENNVIDEFFKEELTNGADIDDNLELTTTDQNVDYKAVLCLIDRANAAYLTRYNSPLSFRGDFKSINVGSEKYLNLINEISRANNGFKSCQDLKQKITYGRQYNIKVARKPTIL